MRDIAGRTGLSKSSLDRHKRDHISATLVKAAETSDLAHGVKLIEQVQILVEKALESLERAEGKGNEREVQGAIREARHSLELTGRITGELRENRDAAPSTALDAIINLAQAMTYAQLKAMAAG